VKADEAQFLELLGGGKKQFIIPIYQRTYSWETEQCEQLWNDLVRVATHPAIPSHFIGPIVHIDQGPPLAAQPHQYVVIDGQQRLTTLSLLLQVLADAVAAAPEPNDIDADQVREDYLFNLHSTGALRYRLLLTRGDRETLIDLLEGRQPPADPSRRILVNYGFFKEKVATSGVDLPTLYQGIAKLMVVDIALDRLQDNPQLIFESLNSTGIDLTQADLIRNYVLMGQPAQWMESLYSAHWEPMERRFGQDRYSERFNRFIRDYLTMRTGTIPNIDRVYKEFKKFAQGEASGPVEEIVSDIDDFSRYFVNMTLRREPDEELESAFEDINTLQVDVAYPFLLTLYDHYHQQRLSHDDFLAMLRLVESYVFRRAVCGVPTNSLNKTFAALVGELDPQYWLGSLEAAFQTMPSNRRFPDDEEFCREFVIKDVYNFRSRNYLLRKLEYAQSGARIAVEKYTIEHILPQNPNLKAAWRRELGEDRWKEVQARYLHTIGNLTLTGHNSELGELSFVEKRDHVHGFKVTGLALNQGLWDLNRWNEGAIRDRAESLAEWAATKIWLAPKLAPEMLKKYSNVPGSPPGQLYVLDENHPVMRDPLGELFEPLRAQILNLDSSVSEQVNGLYISYRADTNFVEIVPQANRLKLILDIPFDELDDPTHICRDLTGVGHWGTGSVETALGSVGQLDDVMYLVLQAFEKQREPVGA
jgi:uncharacterized protein with ParB-like and HNH nuclease domain/predicted transport protein